jgi:hypothetical protein
MEQQTSCPGCGSKIPPGVVHACMAQDYRFPIAIEILAELKSMREEMSELQRIRELLEQPSTPRTRKPKNDIT